MGGGVEGGEGVRSSSRSKAQGYLQTVNGYIFGDYLGGLKKCFEPCDPESPLVTLS